MWIVRVDDFLKVCERGRLFDYISFRLRNDIAGAHNNLLKYCLSFEPDFRQYDLNVVSEFENGLIEWNTQIINSLSKVGCRQSQWVWL